MSTVVERKIYVVFFSFNNCTSTPWTSAWCGESQDSVGGECLMLEDMIVNLSHSSFGYLPTGASFFPMFHVRAMYFLESFLQKTDKRKILSFNFIFFFNN